MFDLNFLRNFSSSRSIKRKRFDDEIVQYSLGMQPGQLNRVGRARRQSQTFAAASPSTANATPTVTSPSQTSNVYAFTEPIASATTPQSTVSAELPAIEIKTEPTHAPNNIPIASSPPAQIVASNANIVASIIPTKNGNVTSHAPAPVKQSTSLVTATEVSEQFVYLKYQLMFLT